LNLHWGFSDNFRPEINKSIEPGLLFPSSIATLLKEGHREPAILNQAWQAIVALFSLGWKIIRKNQWPQTEYAA